MKRALRIVPTVYFIFLAIFWVAEFYMSLGIINYSAVAIIVLLVIQAFYNKKYIGLLYGAVLIAFSVYKIAEAIAVWAETINPTDSGFRFLIIKCVLFGVGLLMAISYFWYYGKVLKKVNTTTTSI